MEKFLYFLSVWKYKGRHTAGYLVGLLFTPKFFFFFFFFFLCLALVLSRFGLSILIPMHFMDHNNKLTVRGSYYALYRL